MQKNLKKQLVAMVSAACMFGIAGTALPVWSADSAAPARVAADDPVAGEKAVFAKLKEEFPKDHIISVEQFKKVWEDVLAGKMPNTYLLDLRTHPEFNTFHIEGADHIHAGHVYTIPGKIKDTNATIYLLCRTGHRAYYVGHFLRQYGYKNLWVVDGGMVAWMKAGYPLVNQFMGHFTAQYADFQKDYAPDFREDGKYRVREFHPY